MARDVLADPLAETAAAQSLNSAQLSSLASRGLTPVYVKTRGESRTDEWIKVDVRDAEGNVTSHAMLSDGSLLDSEALSARYEVQRRAWKAEHGAWDEVSAAVLPDLSNDEVVNVTLKAEFLATGTPPAPLPVEPDQDPVVVQMQHRVHEGEWQQWRDNLVETRLAAATSLQQAVALWLETQPASNGEEDRPMPTVDLEAPGLVQVRCTVAQAQALARWESVASAEVLEPHRPRPQGGSANANEFIGMNLLRDAPAFWRGFGNTTARIKVGHYEPGQNPYARPLTPPGWSLFTLRPGLPPGGNCTTHVQCGACGNQPTDGANGCQCIAGECVSNHATPIRSIISSVDPANSKLVGANGSHYYYDNHPTASNAFNWFITSGCRSAMADLAHDFGTLGA